MSTTTKKKPTVKKSETPKANEKKATPKVEATPKQNGATQKSVMQKIDDVLRPNGNAVVKRLETAQILATKFQKMSDKYDELTQFMAGKDNENGQMKFATENGYSFTLSNPAVINKVLLVIENEFSNHLEEAEKNLLEFQI
ncbi:MAG: hypothetical protein CMO82_11240 [Winogradskyella sp.]|nr:hypothetical protein [Winogradskyella sp.]|tara:strand:- start:274 stop:696 length:423 start_codon:yes stop_codon:yes gene_type:complete